MPEALINQASGTDQETPIRISMYRTVHKTSGHSPEAYYFASDSRRQLQFYRHRQTRPINSDKRKNLERSVDSLNYCYIIHFSIYGLYPKE